MVLEGGAEHGSIVAGFELVGVGVRGSGEGEVDVVVAEGLQQEGDPGEGARGGEVVGLVGALFGVEFGAGDREAGPGVENCCCLDSSIVST